MIDNHQIKSNWLIGVYEFLINRVVHEDICYLTDKDNFMPASEGLEEKNVQKSSFCIHSIISSSLTKLFI